MSSTLALLALRLAVGVIFVWHCRSKLNQKGFMQFIGVAEFAGGLAMILGFLVQFAALGLGIIMLGAIWKKINEWHMPFSAMDKTGWEFDLTILAGCTALMLLGGGSMSIDWMVLGR